MPDRSSVIKPNDRWSMDFVSDRTRNGNKFRVFALIDEVTRYINKAILFYGKPREVISDNGPEFTSNAMNSWAYDKKIEHIFIDPGRPM